MSFILAIFFAFIGSICFIKDGIMNYKKNTSTRRTNQK